MKKLVSFLVLCLLISNLMKAQDSTIKDYLDSYIGVNAKPYVQPLADLFASNINTGTWEWSNFDKKFFVRFKLQGMMSFPSGSMRKFQGQTTGDFRPEQTITVPTIIGAVPHVLIHGVDTTFYIFPGGYNLKQMTLGTPQLTVGGFLNTELSVRFLSFPLGHDLGSVRFIGLGMRHSLSGYLNNPKFDLSVGYFYHHIAAGNYLDSDQQLFSAHIGKAGKIFSGQFMLGYQISDSKIHYDYEIDATNTYEVNLLIHNRNQVIMEANTAIRLGPVFASAGVSYAKHITAVFGAGLFL